MGFLEKIFKKPQKKITVKKDNLFEWLDTNSEKFLEEINYDIEENLDDFKEHIGKLKKKLEKLENANLSNPDIHQKEKQVMEGNRQNYLHKTRLFISSLKIPELDYMKIDKFCKDFEEKLYEFNEDTGKAYFILTNFFNTEMKEIALLIKKMEKNIVSMVENIKDEKVTLYKTLFVKIDELERLDKENEDLTQEVEEKSKDLKYTKERLTEFKQELEKLKQSDDYGSLKKFEKRKKEIEEETDKLKFRLNNKLKSFDKALKKYSHSALKKDLILLYLDTPLKALEQDNNLEILEIIEKLKQEISNEHIPLKDKQKEKVMKTDLTKKFLKNIVKELEKLKKEKKKLNSREDKLTVSMDYKELQYKIEHNSGKIKRLKEEIDEKKNIISHLDIEQKTKRLEEKLSDFSGHEITIS